MTPLHIRFHESLPRLTPSHYRETSDASWDYNCIAWAAGISDAWWWPTPGRYWPPGIPAEETVSAFLAALLIFGYSPGAAPDLQPDFEKIALYATGATPRHAARQLPNGWWTSKLGPSVVIEHETLEDIAGGLYGEVTAILSRAKK